MSKDSVTEYDVDPSNNTDIAGIDINENAPIRNINNAIRTLMAHLKTRAQVVDSTVAASKYHIYDTKAEMLAHVGPEDDDIFYVWNDTDTSLRGLYYYNADVPEYVYISGGIVPQSTLDEIEADRLAAETSASEALSSANTAAVSANTATLAAGNAATSEDNAETSEENAAASEAQALTYANQVASLVRTSGFTGVFLTKAAATSAVASSSIKENDVILIANDEDNRDVVTISQVVSGTVTLVVAMTVTASTLLLSDAGGLISALNVEDAFQEVAADGWVVTDRIADGAITTAKLADSAATETKIADAAVTTAKLADSAATEAKIADSAITTAKLADAAITTAKLADAAITTAKIADNTVTLAKMVDLDSQRVLGRTTAGSGDPESLTAAQVAAMLPTVSQDTKGLVPGPTAAEIAAGKVLGAGGGWVSFGSTATDPSPTDDISRGTTVTINKGSGFIDIYLAVKDFTFSDLISHIYTDDPDLVLVRREVATHGAVVAPNGHTLPADFDIYYAGHGKFATTVDRKEDYRDTFIPPYTKIYYLDNVDGDDANTGLSLAAAKATFISLRNVINADGDTNYLVYIAHKGKAYDQSDGLTHTSLIEKNVGYIGIPDNDGNMPIIGNLYPAASFSFSANATYPQVYESSSSSAAQAGRTFDISKLESHVDGLGRTHKVPTEYAAKSSIAEVAATPGSYWLDTSGSMYYIHTLTGDAPTIGTEIIVHRSIIDSYLVAADYGAYAENFIFVGGILGGVLNQSYTYFNDCISLGSRSNGFYQNEVRNFGTRNCVVINPAADGLNYHNIGSSVSDITQANPAVVTANNHGRNNGDTVVLYDVGGMSEVNWQTFTVANATTNTFELSGVDSTGYGAYTSGGKQGVANPKFHAINPTVIFAGTSEGSNQSTSAHENCEGWTINPYFVGVYRDHITDINESKHCALGGYYGTTRIPASAGSDNRIAQATDNADLAVMAAAYGGYYDPITLFIGGVSNPIRIMDMDLPFDDTKWENVTMSWS